MGRLFPLGRVFQDRSLFLRCLQVPARRCVLVWGFLCRLFSSPSFFLLVTRVVTLLPVQLHRFFFFFFLTHSNTNTASPFAGNKGLFGSFNAFPPLCAAYSLSGVTPISENAGSTGYSATTALKPKLIHSSRTDWYDYQPSSLRISCTFFYGPDRILTFFVPDYIP